MLWCWRYCPHDRPEFVDLVQRLDRMVSESVGTVNIVSLNRYDLLQTTTRSVSKKTSPWGFATFSQIVNTKLRFGI